MWRKVGYLEKTSSLPDGTDKIDHIKLYQTHPFLGWNQTYTNFAVTTHINNVSDCCNDGTNNKSMYLDNVTVEKSSRFKIIQNSPFFWFWNSQSANM